MATEPKKRPKTNNAPIEAKISEESLRFVRETIASGGNRKAVPVRNIFVRSDDPEVTPPLQRLIAARAGLAVKLYLALIWRSSAAPYTTSFRARHWAVLLDLDEPDSNGKRRVKDALNTLQAHKLISLDSAPGLPPVVTLRKEDGSGDDYVVPWDAYRDASGSRVGDMYFQLPLTLFDKGHLQQMSSAALAMLLVVSEESRGTTTKQWWSVETFRDRFGISKDVRAAGTTELERRRLVEVRRQHLPPSPGSNHFTNKERTRKTYVLVNDAVPGKKLHPRVKSPKPPEKSGKPSQKTT